MMLVKIDKTTVMIIKSKQIMYLDFVYDNSNLEEVHFYKHFITYFHHKLDWKYNVEKRIDVFEKQGISTQAKHQRKLFTHTNQISIHQCFTWLTPSKRETIHGPTKATT